MTLNRLAFVDAIKASPAIRLDLNDGAKWRLVADDATGFPPPPLNRAIASTLLANGAVIPAAAYGPRVVRLHLAILTNDAELTTAELHNLFRELDRPFNFLRWQRDTSDPVFFQTKRAAPDQVREMVPRDGKAKHVLLELLAEPFAFGLEETPVSGIAISTDPAAMPDSIRVPNTVGAYASTPDVPQLDIVGDLDIRAKVALDDWTPTVDTWLISKAQATGVARSYALYVSTTGVLHLVWSADGNVLIDKAATVALAPANGTQLWVKATLDVDNGAAGNDVKFWTTVDPLGIHSWTQVGATVTTAGVTSIFNGTNALELGARSQGATNLLIGNFIEGEIRAGIDGTIVAKPVATPFGISDQTGLVWTLNGAAALVRGYPTYVDVVGVKGDVETPALIRWPSSAALAFRETMFAVRRRGRPYAARYVIQAEAMTQGQDTSVQANDVLYSGPGSNYSLITAATSGTSVIERLTVTAAGFGVPGNDLRGRYRLFARVKKVTAGDVWRLQVLVGASHFGPQVILPANASRIMVQLMEELPIPWGADPVTHGASGVEIPAEGPSIALFAGRDSGSTGLHVDELRLVPVDDRTAIVKWASVGSDRWYFDAEDNSRHSRTAADFMTDPGTLPGLSGGFPLLSPDETNRIYALQEVSSALGSTLTTMSPVSISYWPLYVDVPSL